jgi:hypothetical protein
VTVVAATLAVVVEGAGAAVLVVVDDNVDEDEGEALDSGAVDTGGGASDAFVWGWQAVAMRATKTVATR